MVCSHLRLQGRKEESIHKEYFTIELDGISSRKYKTFNRNSTVLVVVPSYYAPFIPAIKELVCRLNVWKSRFSAIPCRA